MYLVRNAMDEVFLWMEKGTDLNPKVRVKEHLISYIMYIIGKITRAVNARHARCKSPQVTAYGDRVIYDLGFVSAPLP